MHGSLDPHESAIQTASQSVQPFLLTQRNRIPNTRQTDRHTELRATSVATGRIYALKESNAA